MNLFANVIAILRRGETKTQRSRTKTGDATQPAINHALGPRKPFGQPHHDSRVGIATLDCKQTLPGHVKALVHPRRNPIVLTLRLTYR
jgi:hypothetical protein